MTGASIQEPPDHYLDLFAFPVKTWTDRFTLVRVCRKINGTWWFSSDGSGRFDVLSPTGMGTCYFGTDATAAILEVFRDQPICRADVEARSLRRVRLAAPRDLADTTDVRVRRFGMTKEIATIVPYDICQRWATRFCEASLGGLFHHLRHDPRPRATGVSLFGPAGAAVAAAWEQPDAVARPITGSEVDASGLVVLPAPPLIALHVKTT